MLLNYHISRLVLSSLCVGDFVWLVVSGVRIASGSTTITKMHGPINIKYWRNKCVFLQQKNRRLENF